MAFFRRRSLPEQTYPGCVFGIDFLRDPQLRRSVWYWRRGWRRWGWFADLFDYRVCQRRYANDQVSGHDHPHCELRPGLFEKINGKSVRWFFMYLQIRILLSVRG